MRLGGGILVALLIGWALPAAAQGTVSVKAYYGTWQGSGVSSNSDSLYFAVTPRDLDVAIHAEGAGFSVAWTTVTHQGGNPQRPNTKRKQDKLVFVPTDRPNVWRTVSEPDLLSGTPYAWARTEGTSLIVYVFTVDRFGRYEMQRYQRTISGGGMALVYTYMRDGERARTVKGQLVKIGP
jgi:hypothetical protein